MDNMYWLKNPIHENLIKFDMTEDFKDKIVTSFDGTIVAVKEDYFNFTLSESEAILQKMGYVKKEETKKKKRGVYYSFIDSEEEFEAILNQDKYSD